MVNNPPAKVETWIQSLGQEDPLEKEMATHYVFLLGKSHGWRSLTVHGVSESNMTQKLHNNN